MEQMRRNLKRVVWILAVLILALVVRLFWIQILGMEVVDNASDENNENTRRKATVVPIKIEYV